MSEKKNIDFGAAKYLYEDESHYFVRDNKGQIGKIPKNKFFHEQIVKTVKEYSNPMAFVRLISPTWVANRNEWVYGKNYIDPQGNQGGVGYSFPECDFLELTDPDSILYAERIYLKKELALLEARKK